MKVISLREEGKVEFECDCGYTEKVAREELVDDMWICRECGKTIQLAKESALDEEMSYKEIELEEDKEAV